MSYALQTLWHERSRYVSGVLAVAFSAVLIALQCGLLLGLFKITSIPIDNTTAGVWIGSTDVQSVDLGKPIPASYMTRVAGMPGVTGVDLYIGQGGAPEGVLACAALKCVGGQFQGRLVFRNADERARAARVGITDFDKKYDLHEMVRADAIFAATGVTKGALLDGVTMKDGFVHTHTLVMNSASHTVREVRMKRPV